MSGYDHILGMSNNAVRAYEAGVKPISSITRHDLERAGLSIPLGFAKWLAKENYWKSYEWHHSGGTWYNEVRFFDPANLAELIEDGYLDIPQLLAKFREQSRKPKEEGQRVKGSFTIWGRKRGRNVDLGTEKFTGTKIGNWIHLDKGGKKKADGRHLWWILDEEVAA